MRKILLFTLVLFCISLLSCNKDLKTNSSGVQTTMNQNLRTDNTGVTLSSAQDLALKYLQYKSPNVNVSVSNALTITKNGIPYFHIINTNAGWAIISSDSLYPPLLAYDTTNNFYFTEKYLSVGLKMWFNKNAHQLEMVRSQKTPYTDSITNVNRNFWKSFANLSVKGSKESNVKLSTITNDIRPNVTPPVLISSVPASMTTNISIGPLIGTSWGQDFPWNEDCPNDPNGGYLNYGGFDAVGCVPEAMGEIMYFWKFPTYYTWTSMQKDNLGITLPLDSWVSNPGGYTQTALLLTNIGRMSHLATYGSAKNGGTSADDANCAAVFEIMGYAQPTRSEGLLAQIYSPENGSPFVQQLTNELQNYARPAMVGGFPSEVTNGITYAATGIGHEWVCEGSNIYNVYTGTTNTYKDFYGNITTVTTYTTLVVWYYLYMDYGNDGLGNGWFSGSDYTYSSADNADYKYFQTIITNIHP